MDLGTSCKPKGIKRPYRRVGRIKECSIVVGGFTQLNE